MASYKRVPLEQLFIDDRYQRPINPGWAKKIGVQFDEAMVGTLEVSQRNGAGKYTVFDGQHRLEAAKIAGVKSLPCLVHKGLSPEEEATLFVALQRSRKTISAVDKFRARLFLGEEKAIEINAIVDECGYRIASAGADAGRLNAVKAINSLEKAHERGNLRETLTLLMDLWGGDDKSTDGGLIEGLSLVVEGYGHRLSDEVLTRLRGTPPLVLLRRVIGVGGGGNSKGNLIASEIRRSAKLVGRPRTKTEAPDA